MTDKQETLLYKLIIRSPYILIADPKLISSRDASLLIDFLIHGKGQYEQFTKAIRRKGPKIPNLVGDYIYEDF